MPFGYGIRTQQYIDVSNAGPRDRIKVTLENDQVVTFQLTDRGRKSTMTDLFVDKARTNDELLEFCYRYAVIQAVGCVKRRERRNYTLEAARTQVEIRLTVESNRETFDNSPLAGKRISVASLFPDTSGSWISLPSAVKAVEFITV